MSWTTTGAVDEFLAQADGFLRADPARNTVIVSATDALATTARHPRDDEPMFGYWRPGHDDAGPVRAAFIHTPPHPPFLSSMDHQAAAELAEELAAAGRLLFGINAERPAADAFAAAWHDRTGDTATVHLHMRLHRLTTLIPPDPAPDGAPRVADERDRDLLIEWYDAFDGETSTPLGRNYAAMVTERLSHGGLTVWEAGGVPVSMAGVTRVVHGMARVAPVYTPPSLRGRGYGGAVTAAVSQAALDAGATEVVLYTDLANPVSNSVYHRLGYHPVEDRVVLGFQRGA